MTHICVSKLTIIGSDNGLSPGRRQAIIWTNAGILSIGTLGKNFSEILSEIHAFSFKKMHLKMSSAKWRPFCLGLNEVRWRDSHDKSRTAPPLCLNHCWLSVKYMGRDKFQWNLNQNTLILIKEIPTLKMLSVKYPPFYLGPPGVI